MICPTCGNDLAPETRFCPRCGTQAPSQPPMAYPSPSAPYGLPYDRVSRNLQSLATLWLVYAVLRALTGMIGILFLHGLFGSHFGHSEFNLGWSPFGRMWMDSLWPMALFSLMISVGCVLLTGWALLTRQPWGRIFAIVFGVIALIHFPLGTALGIYTLWVLAPRQSGEQYAAMAYTQHGA